jgi:hypothetical protein
VNVLLQAHLLPASPFPLPTARGKRVVNGSWYAALNLFWLATEHSNRHPCTVSKDQEAATKVKSEANKHGQHNK